MSRIEFHLTQEIRSQASWAFTREVMSRGGYLDAILSLPEYVSREKSKDRWVKRWTLRDYWFIFIPWYAWYVTICILSYGYGTTSVGSTQPWSADVFLCRKAAANWWLATFPAFWISKKVWKEPYLSAWDTQGHSRVTVSYKKLLYLTTLSGYTCRLLHDGCCRVWRREEVLGPVDPCMPLKHFSVQVRPLTKISVLQFWLGWSPVRVKDLQMRAPTLRISSHSLAKHP